MNIAIPLAVLWIASGTWVALSAEPRHGLPSDAGSGGDADDECGPADPTIQLDPNVEYFGFFMPPSDRSDHYGLNHGQPGPFHLEMDPAPDLPGDGPAPDYDLALLDEHCNPIASSHKEGNGPDVIDIPNLPLGEYVARVFVPEPDPRSESYDSAATFYCHPVCVTIGYKIHYVG